MKNPLPAGRVGMLVLSTTWGGAETVALQLLQRLAARGFSTAIFINDELIPEFSERAPPSTALYSLGKLAASGTLAHAYRTARIHRRLRAAIAESHIDVLHAHLERSLFALAVGARRQQVPVIFTLHGGDSEHYKTPKTTEHRLMKHMLRAMFADPSQYTVTSCARWQRAQFEHQYRARIRFIPNGVDTVQFSPARARTGPPVVLFVGRYAEQKGIAYLRDAAERLPKVSFWCVGKGPLTHLLDLPNITDLGFKTSAQLVPLFRRATVCVFPSLYEALPLVGLEAMASGKAIIATPLGFTEYLTDGVNGCVIPPKDGTALAQAIVALLGNPSQRARMERAARKTALGFEWETIMDKYTSLYAHAVANGKGGRR